MSTASNLRNFAEKCRRMAATELDPRIKSKLVEMAAEYDRKADQLP